MGILPCEDAIPDDPDAERCDPDAVELADISKLCCCDASATTEIPVFYLQILHVE